MSDEERIWYELHFVEREILKFLYLSGGCSVQVAISEQYKPYYIQSKLRILHLKGYVVSDRYRNIARLTTDGRRLAEISIGKINTQKDPA